MLELGPVSGRRYGTSPVNGEYPEVGESHAVVTVPVLDLPPE